MEEIAAYDFVREPKDSDTSDSAAFLHGTAAQRRGWAYEVGAVTNNSSPLGKSFLISGGMEFIVAELNGSWSTTRQALFARSHTRFATYMRKFFFIVWLVVAFVASVHSRSLSEGDLMSIAKDIANPETPTDDESVQRSLRLSESVLPQDNRRFAIILEAVMAIKDATNTSETKEILARLNTSPLNEWEGYYATWVQAEVDALDKNHELALARLDWLIEHYPILEQNSTSGFCSALKQGLEAGDGRLDAFALGTKAAVYYSMGRRADALNACNQVISTFPGTISARMAEGLRNDISENKPLISR